MKKSKRIKLLKAELAALQKHHNEVIEAIVKAQRRWEPLRVVKPNLSNALGTQANAVPKG